MPNFVAVIRLEYKAGDEMEASLIAELAREQAETALDTIEDEDVASVTQIANFDNIVPEEVIIRIAQVRNDLFRTKYKECFEMAKQLDLIKYSLRKQLNPEEVTDYDYGRILEIAHAVITRGENPND